LLTLCSPTEWPQFVSADDELEVICKLSRFYGSDPSIVLAGGGNTSCKVGDRLFVKASGTSLATMKPDGFVRMDRTKLDSLIEAELDSDPDTREAQYKAAISEARCEPEKGQRPSVEVLLHHIVPDTYVVHSHATVVNTLTCHDNGQELAEEIFGDEILWLPFVDPGFILGQELKRCYDEHAARTNGAPIKAILMANHGLIVSGNDPETIRKNTDEVLEKIESRLGSDWQTTSFGTPKIRDDATQLIRTIAPALRGLLVEDGSKTLKVALFDDSPIIQGIVGTDVGKTAACAGPMSPDQIVYCNSYPLWFEPQDGEGEESLLVRLREAIAQHTEETRFPPKVVLVAGVGMFAVGDDFTQANTTRLLYTDAVKVMAGATRLGGVSYLTERDRRFIEDWEVEAYRKKVAAAASGGGGRLKNKVAVVTGAAQGFGLEIARGLASEGAHVVLTDLNEEGAKAEAENLCRQHGAGRSLGLSINVTESTSIRACIDKVLRAYGGFDIFISNAGVLKAESVKTQPEADFDFVTNVNYKGYYLCVQQAAPILAAQHKAYADYRSDIIQINSKSGLVGSKKNFAYAGSKFGGIGLTQSFALELVEDGIKVNSICPGNFFDGPLWSDPEQGLFKQYLRTGKVPGATTVEEVRHFYEAKVPMGRGCRAEDVVTAILYVVDQAYETGQAVPVTGGQDMLR
jgi:rhamnose utilization protein RhaD (predicted bifunctional aldolase and dehydrogenase)/NAD(P)-dependent dehydrogenase (short-subunit alcohol dehydrogenase family)